MTEPQPRLPQVGEYVRMIGKLVEVQDVTPPPPPKELDYIFEETHARAEARVNGKVIETFSTFNNFAGEGTCVEAAIEEAKEKRQHYGPSDLEFVVVKMTSRIRKRANGHKNLYDPTFLDFDSLKNGWNRDLPDDTEEVVWSSKTNDSTAASVAASS